MGSQSYVESSTSTGKSDFASLTSIFINLLLQRNKITLELMRHPGEENRHSSRCSVPRQQQVPRAGISILLFLNVSVLV